MLFCLLALTSLVHAAAGVGGSEYQHQTAEGRLEVTPNVGYRNENRRAKPPTLDFDVKGFRESVLVEYGLSYMFSAGVWLGGATDQFHATESASSDYTRSGLFDPSLFLHGRHDHERCSLRYGLNVDFGLGRGRADNYSSGGIALIPFVGYEMTMGPSVGGVRVSLRYFVGNRKFTTVNPSTTAEEDLAGSTALVPSLFYEWGLTTLKIGASLALDYVGETDEKVNGVTSGAGDKHSAWNFALYAPWDYSTNLTFIPRFTYGEWNAFNTAQLDSLKTWQLDVGARFAF